jgi:hypothetical protein
VSAGAEGGPREPTAIAKHLDGMAVAAKRTLAALIVYGSFAGAPTAPLRNCGTSFT